MTSSVVKTVGIAKGFLGAVLGFIAVCVFAASASAATIGPVNGSITFSGVFKPTDINGNPVDINTAVGSGQTTFTVDSATGDFAALLGNPGTMEAFTFNPFTPTVSPLWTVGNFSFDLHSLSTLFQGAGFLILDGAGFVINTFDGFDNTPGTWSLTANTAGPLFNFSAGSTAVPLPAAAWLFGSAILGLTVVARRRRGTDAALAA